MEEETLPPETETEPSTEPVEPVPDGETVADDERFQEMIDALTEQNELMVEQNDLLQQQLDIQSNPVELPPDADYTDYLSQMLSLMSDWNDYIVGAGSALVTYSVFYIPLLVILVALYWFFKQFWTQYS